MSAASRRPNGYLMLEVLICIGVIASVLSMVVAGVYGMQRVLGQAARREFQAQAWTTLSARLRDDLRRSTSVSWRHDPVTPREFSLTLQLPGGDRVVYENSPAGIGRRADKKMREADFFARVPASLLGVQRFSQGIRAPRGMWEADPVPHEDSFDDVHKEPSFIMLMFELELPDGTKRREAVGASPRTQTAGESR